MREGTSTGLGGRSALGAAAIREKPESCSHVGGRGLVDLYTTTQSIVALGRIRWQDVQLPYRHELQGLVAVMSRHRPMESRVSISIS